MENMGGIDLADLLAYMLPVIPDSSQDSSFNASGKWWKCFSPLDVRRCTA